MAMIKDLKENYTPPIYFLASLGSGGLTVSFFVYFMFMVDHPNTPVATFDFIFPVLTGRTLSYQPLSSSLTLLWRFSFICISGFLYGISQSIKSSRPPLSITR